MASARRVHQCCGRLPTAAREAAWHERRRSRRSLPAFREPTAAHQGGTRCISELTCHLDGLRRTAGVERASFALPRRIKELRERRTRTQATSISVPPAQANETALE